MGLHYQDSGVSLYDGDLRTVLSTLPEKSVDFVVTDPPYGLAFMGKDWDSQVPGPEYWQAIARVCKPGALMLAFGGTRTWHRLASAIEDAGWEIRDCLMWLQGQGFPKATDVGKMIDKAKGGSELAQVWTGWAGALKPGWEPITLAMKSMDGTIAQNAETYGVAGMNIDACRIATDENLNGGAYSPGKQNDGEWGTMHAYTGASFVQPKGRWPANLLLDEVAAAQLDAQSGVLTSGTMKAGQVRKATKGKGGYHGNMPDTATAHDTPGDSGGASRFFYTAKATKKEKGAFNDHPTVKPVALMDYLLTLLSTPTGGVVLDPFAGSGHDPRGGQTPGADLHRHRTRSPQLRDRPPASQGNQRAIMAIEKIELLTKTSSGRTVLSPAQIERRDGRIFFVKSPFSLKDEIKAMKGAKWHGYESENPVKQWSVEDCQRNNFQLALMCGKEMFEWFDRDLIRHEYRPLARKGVPAEFMPHQMDMTDAGLTYHFQLWAAEMGTGKTLAAQMLIENSGVNDWFWIGPKTSLPNIQREFRIWGFPAAKFDIQYCTYEGLVRIIDEWPEGVDPPHGLICDESSRLKNFGSPQLQGRATTGRHDPREVGYVGRLRH